MLKKQREEITKAGEERQAARNEIGLLEDTEGRMKVEMEKVESQVNKLKEECGTLRTEVFVRIIR
jgi:uncharacterized protein (DUF3084 family)